MKDHIERWGHCLQIIRQYLPKDTKIIPSDDAEWVWHTWFEPITCESFDPTTGALLLCVPSRQVIDYIEHYRMPLWSWALHTAFGQNLTLSYRVASSPVAEQQGGVLGDAIPNARLQFSIPDARERLEAGLRRAVGDDYRWLDKPYDKIVSWLSDNQGRGLLFVGPTGTGKSVMCCDILPEIIGGKDRDMIRVVTAEQMLKCGDELKHASVVVIDGLGREPRLHYGSPDNTFLDLCEASVQGGPLLIISTCLSTSPVSNPLFSPLFPDSIEHRYGAEVLDRLKAIVTTAVCYDASVRTRK